MKRAFHLLVLFSALAIVLSIAPSPSASAASNDRDPHEHLNSILQRPIYQAWRMRQEQSLVHEDISIPHGLRDWMAGVRRAIRDFFEWLFGSGRSSGRPSFSMSEALPTFLRILAWFAVAVALCFACIFLIRLLGKSKSPVPTANVLSRRQVNQALEAGDALALDSAEWMDEARRLAAEQNFRAVYRALYLALLSGLHTAGKIEHHRNRTNWAYVQHYRGPSNERAVFADLTALFDRVWYGRKDAGGADLETLRNQVTFLTQEGALA